MAKPKQHLPSCVFHSKHYCAYLSLASASNRRQAQASTSLHLYLYSPSRLSQTSLTSAALRIETQGNGVDGRLCNYSPMPLPLPPRGLYFLTLLNSGIVTEMCHFQAEALGAGVCVSMLDFPSDPPVSNAPRSCCSVSMGFRAQMIIGVIK